MALNDRQKLFVLAYVETLNATEAAKQAGYSDKTARSIGSENLTKPDIRAEIDRHFEARSMGKGEVLARLTDIARGDMGDFISVEGDEDAALVYTNLGKAKAIGRLRLIRKIKITERDLGESGREVKTEIELYDAQAALNTLGRKHGVFDSKREDDDSDEPEEDEAEIGDDALRVEAALLEAANGSSSNRSAP